MVMELKDIRMPVSETFTGHEIETVPFLSVPQKLSKTLRANSIPLIMIPSTGK
jgi:hypothetical protein